MPADVGGARAGVLATGQNSCAQRHQRTLGVAPVGVEIAERRHRLVIEIEAVRIDQAEQRLDRQRVLRDGI